MRVRTFIVAGWCLVALVAASRDVRAADGPALVVERIEAALARGDTAAYRSLLAPTMAAERAAGFSESIVAPGVTRAVVRERDRAAVRTNSGADALRLIIEVFIERGQQASIYTYRIDLYQLRDAAAPTLEEPGWRIFDQEVLTSVEGLFRLKLNPDKQFAIRNLEIDAEDFVLAVASGSAFVSETPAGVTGVVVLGNGEMRFTPRPAAERGQVRLFCGRESLVTPMTAAFVRVNPSEFKERLSQGGLVEETVDARAFARAEAIFAEEVSKSFALDLRELSRESWSLVPGFGDFLAEVRTRKYDTLTYAQSTGEPEDVTLFDRKKRRNISVYPSQRVMETRGLSYNEDEMMDFDILDYDIEASFVPDREWLEGRARIKLRVRNYVMATLTLKLHEALVVHSIFSDQQGRLLSIRVKGQNSVIVNLPKPAARDDVMTLRVAYGGRLPPQAPEREVVEVAEQREIGESPMITAEPRYVFSNRSYWYPQSGVTDFATARLKLIVPVPFTSVASGSPAAANPTRIRATRPGEADQSVSEFFAGQPLRYLSWTISTFTVAAQRTVSVPPASPGSTAGSNGNGMGITEPPASSRPGWGVRYDSLDLSIMANRRQIGRGRTLIDSVQEVLQFYAGLLNDLPYPSFTLALVDNELPGGHSPAYFALLYQPLPTTPYVWRNDPVHFDNFPHFFLAHELAHQYWGQAVGWKSYHEQWISEAFAQYFAALYAEKHGEPGTFRDVLRRMRKTVLDNEDQGPIYLGYRLGHIRGDSRVFRAIVYNKGAAVLHMLRRLVGDDLFFKGLKLLYESSRFSKIGTDDVRQTFEKVTGRALETFFAHWVYDGTIPRIRWSWRVETPGTDSMTDQGRSPAAQETGASEIVIRFDQGVPEEQAFQLPVTVTFTYTDNTVEEVIVPITSASLSARLPLRGALRTVDVNVDGAALARFERQ